MDWKKIVLASVFSSIAIITESSIGIFAAMSILVYMLVDGMERCKIATLGLLLNFAAVLLYPILGLSQFGVLSVGTSFVKYLSYLSIIGAVLIIVGFLIVAILRNKLAISQ
ncbi:hypothetical protein MJ1_0549 [Nanobdella aerobiophila]|uniref:Uncharacterized protein n=1 Tax=Nanobdella aerobiophila TaxID=2586965 RepID=A0A915WS97_9ARCH|nr:hypothetical protein [Nanobdella aerobiophila]BBL45701.1 hypothetical protein MJ1_0549 [Nanobdella aerobiophila]